MLSKRNKIIFSIAVIIFFLIIVISQNIYLKKGTETQNTVRPDILLCNDPIVKTVASIRGVTAKDIGECVIEVYKIDGEEFAFVSFSYNWRGSGVLIADYQIGILKIQTGEFYDFSRDAGVKHIFRDMEIRFGPACSWQLLNLDNDGNISAYQKDGDPEPPTTLRGASEHYKKTLIRSENGFKWLHSFTNFNAKNAQVDSDLNITLQGFECQINGTTTGDASRHERIWNITTDVKIPDCNLVGNLDSNRRGACYFQEAVEKNDLSWCSKIPMESVSADALFRRVSTRAECALHFALKSLDKNICENAFSQPSLEIYELNWCTDYIDFEKKW